MLNSQWWVIRLRVKQKFCFTQNEKSYVGLVNYRLTKRGIPMINFSDKEPLSHNLKIARIMDRRSTADYFDIVYSN